MTAKVEQVQSENEALKAENKLIKEQIPSSSASGNSIHIEDSGTLDFDWKINGGHKQETRSGSNLLNFNVAQNSRVTVNEDGTVTINGQGGFTLNAAQITLQANKSYKEKIELVSGNIKDSSGNDFANNSIMFDGNWLSTKNYNTSIHENDVKLNGCWINAGAVFNNAKIKIWAYEGTEDKPFEQYGVSPSPDYPSEVETVGSNINLCDGINQEYYLNVETSTCELFSNNSGLIIPVCGGEYTISTKVSQERYRVACVNEKPLQGKTVTAYRGINKDKSSENITIDTSDYAYLIINATDLTKIKIEKGSVATPYSPCRNGQCRNRCDE